MIKRIALSVLFLTFVALSLIINHLLLITSSVQAQSDQQKIISRINERLKKMKARQVSMQKYTQITDVEFVDPFNTVLLLYSKSIEKAESCLRETDNQKLENCDKQTKNEYNTTKSAYRLVKLYAIMAGTPSTCINANMGVKPLIEATALISTDNKLVPLYLCSGPNHSATTVDLRWRVQDKDGNMVKIKEDLSTNLEQFKNRDNIRQVERSLGLKEDFYMSIGEQDEK